MKHVDQSNLNAGYFLWMYFWKALRVYIYHSDTQVTTSTNLARQTHERIPVAYSDLKSF